MDQEAKLGPEARLRRLESMWLRGPRQHPGEVLSLETLMDILIVLYEECSHSSLRREKTLSQFAEIAKPIAMSIKQLRLRKDDFKLIKVIGKGAFGEVSVVKEKVTGKVYAMKTLNKWYMLKRADAACYKEERDVLVFGNRQWITRLHFAFQDASNLYFVMDYYNGGDLLTVMSKFDDKMPEDLTRFYIAEMLLAVQSVHQLGYIHRDVKPDNILLDSNGHIRLADFGSCLKLGADNLVHDTTAVGTPDYIAPEVLMAFEDGKGRYGPQCDFWSVGVVMYEMLFGETPFYAESLIETYGKIMSHYMKKKEFEFPEEVDVTEDTMDLITRMCLPAHERLGKGGIDDFKTHPFFTGITWEGIKDGPAPYNPGVTGETDTSNFDCDDVDFKPYDASPPKAHIAFSGHHLPFIGFTYSDMLKISDCNSLMGQARGAASADMTDGDDLLERIKNLKKENKELGGQILSIPDFEVIEDTTQPHVMRDYVRQLQEEINSLRMSMRFAELRTVEQDSTLQHLKQANKNLNTQEGERDEVISQLKDNISVLERQKEEYSAAQTHLDEVQMQLQSEKRDKEQSQEYAKQLEAQLEKLQQNQQHVDPEIFMDIARLKSELEQKDVQHSIAIETLQGESTEAQKKLEDSESKFQALEKETQQSKKSLEDIVEEHALKTRVLDQQHGREKAALEEDRSRLQSSVEQFHDEVEKLISEKHQLVDEIDDLKIEVENQRVPSEKEEAWKRKRTQKVEKMELLQLQSTVQAEVAAKQDISDELAKSAAARAEAESKLSQAEQTIEDLRKELHLLRNEIRQLRSRPNGDEDLRSASHFSWIEKLFRTHLPSHSVFWSDEDDDWTSSFSGRQGNRNVDDWVSWIDEKPGTRMIRQERVSRQGSRPADTTRVVTVGESHHFALQTQRSDERCATCRRSFPGISNQVLVCQSCGIACHFECSKSVPVACTSNYTVQTPGSTHPPSPAPSYASYKSLPTSTPPAYASYMSESTSEPASACETPSGSKTPTFTTPGYGSSGGGSVARFTTNINIKVGSRRGGSAPPAPVGTAPGITDFAVETSDSSAASSRRSTSADLPAAAAVAREAASQMKILEAIDVCETPGTTSRNPVRNINCAVILDSDVIVMGTNTGLFVLELTGIGATQVGESRTIHQIEYIDEGAVLLVIIGPEKQALLVPVVALEGFRLPWTPLPGAEGVIACCAGKMNQATPPCAFVAMPDQVLIYEITRSSKRFRQLQSIMLPNVPICMDLMASRLCVGHLSNFTLISVFGDKQQSLVNKDDKNLQFLRATPHQPLGAVKVTQREFLLFFDSVAIFVDNFGNKLEQMQNIAYPSPPIAMSVAHPYVCLYSETEIAVYDVQVRNWVQYLPLKNTTPMNRGGSLCLCRESELPRLLYLRTATGTPRTVAVEKEKELHVPKDTPTEWRDWVKRKMDDLERRMEAPKTPTRQLLVASFNTNRICL
ncbi:PREDICTED: serine/threonine-protein kinase MRCK alpha-like [Priapulus caudatus]|uniref:non-specific serine/threonine protein kinase n=1 Tax=Priapulus caudatus TaxID=37621 RepID=A0ABM1E974_PRICU|nr:PREDICTED: serine/threonine-protein kinase MRCK alpha-like [Priapulus caudatus]